MYLLIMEIMEEAKQNSEEVVRFYDSRLERILDLICNITMDSQMFCSLLVPCLQGLKVFSFPIH